MNKKLLLLSGAALATTALSAQQLQTNDVIFPQSTKLHEYIEQWNGGAGTFRMPKTENGQTVTVDWEDQEFFTSRVKPRTRITTTTGANVNDFGSQAGRRSMWWVPIGDPSTQALPNAVFNSEAFSMWSYLDVYGCWTAPYGWVTGAFADIAHKNGVSVSGQASIPNATISGDWLTSMTTMGSKYGSSTGAETVGKFLLYHGCDGLAYNSEFYGGSNIVPNLMNLHNNLMVYMKDRNPLFENIWYDGTNDSGTCSFDSFLNGKTGIYKGSSMFSNYNWNRSTSMANAVSLANGVTDPNGNVRGPWWNYAGMNQQGGEPKVGENYPILKANDWSMGWWGAHERNMFWEGRGAFGTNDEAILMGYLNECEQFFGNGPRNPAIHKQIKTVRAHRPSDDYHGASEFINERSVLDNKLATEPFYTFFNLGNGKFFNWKGERVSNQPWYSIGVQDYLPTWRFWTAPTWLQKTVEEGTVNLNVGFTYEDAFFGGSCLKIEGTTDTEYLHLFKSAMTGLGGKTVTIRYKLLEGTGDVRLVLTSSNTPETQPSLAALKQLHLFTTDECSDLENESYREGPAGWQTKSVKLPITAGNATNMPGGLGVIGLEVKNAKGLKLLLGELSISGSSTTTPEAPVIRSAKVLRNVYTGVDGKIIWTMDNDVARLAGTPKYNSDVNASMYKVYSREEGGDAQFLGVTTSWAAIAFRAPNTDASKKIQFGVSAVSIDTKSESAITWSSLMDKGSYTQSEDIKLSKLTIKPGEDFKVSFVDQKHNAVDWTIKNQKGEVLATANGIEIDVPNGLPEWGGYDLTVGDKEYPYYIQISDEKVGALPRIYEIANENGNLEGVDKVNINLEDNPVLSYTGRQADGNASRALNLNSRYVGANIGDLGIEARKSISIAGWFNFKSIPELSWNFMNISNKGASWPQNTWGWAWNHGTPDGRIFCTFRGNTSDSAAPGELHYTFPDTRLQAGVWTHIAWICEYADAGFRAQLYINGVKQKSTVYSYAQGNNASAPRYAGDYVLSWHTDANGEREGDNDGDIYINNQTYPISASDWAYFGGAAHQGAAIDGVVDDFQVWNKAMTADDVKASMAGFPAGSTLPEGLLSLWDFETDADENYYFYSRGSKEGVKGCSHDLEHENGNPEAASVQTPLPPMYDQGCPFLEGTAYPVVTEATWTDDIDRKTGFEKKSRAGSEDTEGSVAVKFNKTGDHTITLDLANSYGSDTRTFPVYVVGPAAIDGIGADAEGVRTYTVDRTLFVEFEAAGSYTVQVFNAAGMMVGNKTLNAAAGQSARVDLGAAGVYLVKVVRDGQELRTLKVLSK